jgi:predicted nucleic acid-binding protein
MDFGEDPDKLLEETLAKIDDVILSNVRIVRKKLGIHEYKSKSATNIQMCFINHSDITPLRDRA